MRLSALDLRHFRNLGRQELELPSEGVALIGDNAQGKSNLLEAIYYLETLRSFRGARDEEMVAFGQDVFRVVGCVEPGEATGEDSIEVAAAFQRRGRRKKVTLDGVEGERLSDTLGRLSAVIFSPSDIDLVSGGPAERRRFLDIVLSLNETGYVEALQDYRKILKRRNASLKAGDSPSLVRAWEPGLVRAGAVVMHGRREWIRSKRESFGRYYARISAGACATMAYRPDVALDGADGVDAIEQAFRDALAASGPRERRRGVTVVGPHRDDVRLSLEGGDERLDLRSFGSGGQRRTAALALRLIEGTTIRERRSRKPLILLDDVFAELDAGRSERILDLLESEETGQVVLTAPKESDVHIRRDALPRWRISSGRVSA